MTTARQDPTRYLCRERQFCSLCFAAGAGWVQVHHAGRRAELSDRAFRAERNRAAMAHLKAEHPKAYGEVTGKGITR